MCVNLWSFIKKNQICTLFIIKTIFKLISNKLRIKFYTIKYYKIFCNRKKLTFLEECLFTKI